MREADRRVRAQLAFLGAARTYRRVFDRHGWGHVHERWADMLKAGETKKMGDLVDDEMLHIFAVVAEPERVAFEIAKRYEGFSERTTANTPYRTTEELRASMAAGVRACGNSMPG